MKRLIVIEGFDRCGKDTLLEDLEKYCKKKYLKEVYVFKNDLEGLPKYDKEQGEFLVWLNKYIEKQVDRLNELFETYDTVVMSRFLISDMVYSELFKREHTVIKYMEKLRPVMYYNYCMLFRNYDEYLKRLEILGDKVIQYTKEEFDQIKQYYHTFCLWEGGISDFKYVNGVEARQDILEEFIKKYKIYRWNLY